MANIVAITGRPNVGKSTLFNRLIEQRQAITDNESGVTRDRHYGKSEWNGKKFTVIDTGGYVHGSDDIFEASIREQVELAMEEASVILFMMDCQTGLTDLDKDFAHVLRRSKKPVLIIANKADNQKDTENHIEFYELGFEAEIFPISSQSGTGTGELLDELVKLLADEEPPEEDLPRFSILGRPNVGKSSFLNALLGKDRSIVTNIAGTTRDAINTRYKAFGHDFILTDTAGIRRKAKVKENIEFYSVMRSLKALEHSDVCILVLDAERGLESQDMNLLHLAHKNNKGVVILVNKWDLLEKDTNTAKKYRQQMVEKLKPNDYPPIIFISALEKQRVYKAVETSVKVYENMTKQIPTSKLNEVMLEAIANYPPPAYRGKDIRIKYITQINGKVPTFLFFCNYPTHIKEPYQRYLENKMRQNFDFEGVPIRIFFRKK